MAYMVIPMMTAKQYQAALDRLNISQLKAGELFKVGARTSRRWALDEARVPPAVAMILELMLKKTLTLEIPANSISDRRVWTFSAKEKVG
jgi:hypothetical protein